MKKLYVVLYLLFFTRLIVHAQGPVFIKNISGKATNFKAVENTLFYTSNDSLFKSDGTAAGTVFVKKGINAPKSFLENNGLLYFITTPDNSLWRSDGTAAGTFILATPDAANRKLEYLGPGALGNKVVFTKYNAANNIEPYATDGSLAGTVLLSDIYPGSNSSTPKFLGKLNSLFLFTAINLDGSTPQNELWKTDGTPSGTSMVKDINPTGSTFGMPINIFPYNAAATATDVYFTANDGTNGAELWKSNGTASGTIMVYDAIPGSAGGYYYESGDTTFFVSAPGFITEAGGIIYYIGGDGYKDGYGSFYTLWKSDGTSTGTRKVADIPVDNIQSLFEVNNKVIIIGSYGIAYQLWSSNGTKSGTVMIKDQYRGGDNYYSNFAFMGQNVAFTDDVQGYSYQLWKSNGDLSGTSLLKQLPSAPGQVLVVGDTLFFTAHGVPTEYESGDGENDYELWQSDLTTGGTVKVKDLTNTSWAFSSNLTNVNGALFFTTSTMENFSPYANSNVPKKLWRYSIKPLPEDTLPADTVTVTPTDLIMVNVSNGLDIRTLNSSDTLYMDQQVEIRANAPAGTKSVRFYIDNVFVRNENTAPYALSGDNNGVFKEWNKSPGLYKIAAVPYTGFNGTGTKGDSMISYVRVLDAVTIPSNMPFILVNTINGTDVRQLVDGETITMPVANRITIRTEPDDAESVVFILNGSIFHTENSAPFSLNGDNAGTYYAWIANTGSYTLIANAYSGHNGTGTLVQSDTIHFVIILTASKLAAYPNPINNQMTIETEGIEKEEVTIQLIDHLGKVISQEKTFLEAGNNSVPMNTDSLIPGIYYVKVIGTKEEKVIKIYKR